MRDPKGCWRSCGHLAGGAGHTSPLGLWLKVPPPHFSCAVRETPAARSRLATPSERGGCSWKVAAGTSLPCPGHPELGQPTQPGRP